MTSPTMTSPSPQNNTSLPYSRFNKPPPLNLSKYPPTGTRSMPTNSNLNPQRAVSPVNNIFSTPTKGRFLPSPNQRASFVSGSGRESPSTSPVQSRMVMKPNEEQVEEFEELCAQLYYEKDLTASIHIDQFLKSVHPSTRSYFSKVQAAVRSQFHQDLTIFRKKQLTELLDQTKANSILLSNLQGRVGSEEDGLPIANITNLRSKEARNKRYALLIRYLHSHGSAALVGTHPFLKSLYTVLDLQRRAKNKKQGGAGEKRIEWEVDEAALIEAGGGDWMKDTVEMLKGVLGFSERMLMPDLSRPASAYTASTEDIPHPLSNHHHPPTSSAPVISTTTQIPQESPANLSEDDVPALDIDDGEDDAEVDGPFSDEIDENMQEVIDPSAVENNGKKRKTPIPGRRHTVVRKISNLTVSSASAQSEDMEMEASSNNGRSRSDSDPFIDPNTEEFGTGGRRPSVLGREVCYEEDGEYEEQVGEDDEEALVLDPTIDDLSPPRTESGLLAAASIPPAPAIDITASSSKPSRPILMTTNSSRSTPMFTRTRLNERIATASISTAPRSFIFTFPSHLTNPELDLLCSCFPSYLVTKKVKFERESDSKRKSADGVSMKSLEDGRVPNIRYNGTEEVRAGHGIIRLGRTTRDVGWKGSFFERFGGWFRRLFGRK